MQQVMQATLGRISRRQPASRPCRSRRNEPGYRLGIRSAQTVRMPSLRALHGRHLRCEALPSRSHARAAVLYQPVLARTPVIEQSHRHREVRRPLGEQELGASPCTPRFLRDCTAADGIASMKSSSRRTTASRRKSKAGPSICLRCATRMCPRISSPASSRRQSF